MNKNCEQLLRILLLSVVCTCAAGAQAPQGGGSLDQDIQTIKQQLLELNRDLLILEEELLFPSDSRLAVFLSMNVGDTFSLDAVRLSIDDTQVTHYLYTERQLGALRRGGVHRLYVGNLKTGEHSIFAELTGKDPSGLDYRREARLDLEKTSGVKNLELKITDSADLQQPQFSLEEW